MIPLFYALIKIHKPGNPIRPIVSFIDSPSYNIAKFISDLLTPFTDVSQQKLKNSLDLKQKLKDFIIPTSHKLVSYDVKALFTSIPQSFAIQCVREFLQKHNSIFEKTKLDISEICQIVQMCFDATLFSFNK